MNFPTAVLTCLKKYTRFSGRASRSEFWYFFLFEISGSILLGLPEYLADGKNNAAALLPNIYFLLMLLPGTAVGVRRLHDIGRGGALSWVCSVFAVLLTLAMLVLIPYSAQNEHPTGSAEETLGAMAFLLIFALYLISLIVLMLFASKKGTLGENRYGPDPLGQSAALAE